MNAWKRNADLNPGTIVYYYPQSIREHGLHPCTILEEIDVRKHGIGGGLTYYLVEVSCAVDCYAHMLTNMQIYTKEEKEALE